MKRIFAGMVVLLAAASLLISLAGILEVWSLRQPVANSLRQNLDLLSATLDTTQSSLGVAGGSLQAALDTVGTLRISLVATSQTLSNTTTTLGTVGGFLDQDLPNAIRATQSTLASAQSSARVVDEVLTGLSSLPIFNLQYKPDVPLNIAIGQVAQSIDKLPASLDSIHTGMTQNVKDLGGLAAQLRAVSDSLDTSSKSLAGAQVWVKQYQDQIAGYRQGVQTLRANLDNAVLAAALGIIFVLAWLMVTQIQILLTGLRWLNIPFPWNTRHEH